MKTRAEINEKYKWDLSSYFKSQKDWEQELESVKALLPEFADYEGKLNNETDIFACLLLDTEVSKRLGLLYVYAALRTKEDQGNSKAQEALEKVSSLSTLYSAETSFIMVELSALSTEFLTDLKNNNIYPQFSNFFEDVIKMKPHTLSKPEEKLLSLMSDFSGGFSDNFDKFDDADLVFDDILDSEGRRHQLNHSNFILHMESPDRVLRENAMKSMNAAYKKFNNFLTSNYTSVLKKNKFSAKIRNFSSPLQAAIFSEDASEKVYKTLIEQVNKNVKLFQKYLKLKQKQLKLDKFALYDLYAPVVEEHNLKLEYEEAMELIKEATKVLGKDYTNLLTRAQKERWIDVMPNLNKDSGAFSWGAYGANPVVLTNYVKNTNSVFTLAHELGHCMHTYYSNANQPYEKAGYTIFVAEVASTVNEMLLLEHLLSKAKIREEKIYYYDYVLSMVRGTIFRQTMFSEFEAFAHDQVQHDLPISKDVLNNFYLELNKRYFGKDVELIEEIAYEWSRIPHFYTSFYVYKYATGLISALAIVNKILSGEENAQANYIKFLSSGSSLPPVELLKIANVDLENEQTFNAAFAYIASVIERWEKLMK